MESGFSVILYYTFYILTFMEATFKLWNTNREKYLGFLNNYTIDQLNTIPAGFNNNLIWHVGHIIVAQQSLIYKATGTPMHISDELYERYKSGTVPSGKTTQEEIDELRDLLFSLIEKTKMDYRNDVFSVYNERTTGTGFHLASIRDGFEFNNYHEGMHLGMMMSLRKFL